MAVAVLSFCKHPHVRSRYVSLVLIEPVVAPTLRSLPRVDGGPEQRAGVSGECGVGVGEEAGWLVQEEVRTRLL